MCLIHFLRIFLPTSKSSCQILKIVSFVSEWGWHLWTLSSLIAELSLRTKWHVISARCVARDLHMIAPGPLERTYWKQFAALWGDCKKSRIVPFNVIIIIFIIIIIIDGRLNPTFSGQVLEIDALVASLRGTWCFVNATTAQLGFSVQWFSEIDLQVESQNPAAKQTKMPMEKSHWRLQPLYWPN